MPKIHLKKNLPKITLNWLKTKTFFFSLFFQVKTISKYSYSMHATFNSHFLCLIKCKIFLLFLFQNFLNFKGNPIFSEFVLHLYKVTQIRSLVNTVGSEWYLSPGLKSCTNMCLLLQFDQLGHFKDYKNSFLNKIIHVPKVEQQYHITLMLLYERIRYNNVCWIVYMCNKSYTLI